MDKLYQENLLSYNCVYNYEFWQIQKSNKNISLTLIIWIVMILI